MIYKNLTDELYSSQLNRKINLTKSNFATIFDLNYFDIFKSKIDNFRDRVEFRLWHSGDDLNYVMFDRDKNIVKIDRFEIASVVISNLMPKLLDRIKVSRNLKYKIFAVEFFSSSIGDILVTLIYHKKLDGNWSLKAKELAKELNISIIGRSRGQKVVIDREYINEKLKINDTIFKYRIYEGSFTQPNSYINKKMIKWTLDNINSSKDLVELYCGVGNFTLPLSKKFNRVLATEISKTSIKSALENCKLNSILNIDFIRMSSEEFTDALNGVREFNRLKGIDLKSYDFSTIFVDPPRAGLDFNTRELVLKFENIIYISCNQDTLKRDLEYLLKFFKVEKFAIFDQFPYTEHIESGVILKKIN